MNARAEIEKLARVLHVEPERLDALEGCPPEAVRALRHATSDTLFEDGRRHFLRAAAAAKLIPAALAAKLAQHALGPLLSARVAGLIDTSQAHDLARRLPPEFLADIAVELDTRHAGDVLVGLPPGLISETAAVLEARGEYVAMGMFVGHLDPATLTETVDALSDDAVLRVGFLLEAPERLDGIIGELPDERLAAILLLASEDERWEELLGLSAYLGDEQLDRVLELGEELGLEPALRAAAGRDPAVRAMAAPLLSRRAA